MSTIMTRMRDMFGHNSRENIFEEKSLLQYVNAGRYASRTLCLLGLGSSHFLKCEFFIISKNFKGVFEDTWMKVEAELEVDLIKYT